MCEVMIVVVFFVVMVVVVMVEFVGFFMVMGLFFVGVMLFELSFWYELEVDIEFFCGILFGLFFMVVGMLFDL